MRILSLFHPKFRYLAAGFLLPIALAGACLAALVVGAASGLAAKSGAVPQTEIVRVCVSLRLAGGPRLATWWAPAFNSRSGLMRRAYLQSNMACGLAQW
ncbi:MAG: hypothetical protein ABI847_10995, partial [Anaerolineales bacterium]